MINQQMEVLAEQKNSDPLALKQGGGSPDSISRRPSTPSTVPDGLYIGLVDDTPVEFRATSQADAVNLLDHYCEYEPRVIRLVDGVYRNVTTDIAELFVGQFDLALVDDGWQPLRFPRYLEEIVPEACDDARAAYLAAKTGATP